MGKYASEVQWRKAEMEKVPSRMRIAWALGAIKGITELKTAPRDKVAAIRATIQALEELEAQEDGDEE
ncbi:MAG: hypothetical protein IJ206_09400 [Oscillospiraceae bacterium]|nr:hypothetical protein [Oscillospiraceae bacterium]